MRFLGGLILGVTLIGLLACGSTKVYQSQKTVAHQGDIYNLTSVTKISSRLETVSPAGQSIDLKGADKGQLQTYVGQWGPLEVTSYIDMDAQHMTYETGVVRKYSDLRRMQKNLDSAMSSIQDFMKHKKSRQLNLK